jgi:hypothetical protein
MENDPPPHTLHRKQASLTIAAEQLVHSLEQRSSEQQTKKKGVRRQKKKKKTDVPELSSGVVPVGAGAAVAADAAVDPADVWAGAARKNSNTPGLDISLHETDEEEGEGEEGDLGGNGSNRNPTRTRTNEGDDEPVASEEATFGERGGGGEDRPGANLAAMAEEDNGDQSYFRTRHVARF